MNGTNPARPEKLRVLLVVAAVVLAVAGAWWALTVWMPAPPRIVTMATGPEGGAYAALGARYQAIFAARKSNSAFGRRWVRWRTLRCCGNPGRR